MTVVGETWVAMWTRWLVDVFDLTELEATAIARKAVDHNYEISPSTLTILLAEMAHEANLLHEAPQRLPRSIHSQ